MNRLTTTITSLAALAAMAGCAPRPDAKAAAAAAHTLTVSSHAKVAATTAGVDAALLGGSKALKTDDDAAGAGDVACDVTLSRSGAIGAFTDTTIPRDINTEADLDKVLAEKAHAKIVRLVAYCADAGDYAGCAQTGKTLVIQWAIPVGEGIAWAHEFGHNADLDHRGHGRELMTEEPLAANQNFVNAAECQAFKGGPKLAAPAGAPQPAAAGARLPIQELVRRPVLDHMPYALYASYPATDTDVLLKMLDDPAQSAVWPNVVRALGIMGDARAAPRLITFVQSPGSITRVDPDQVFHTRVGALFALGYIVNRTGDSKALSALREMYSRGPTAAVLSGEPEETRGDDARTLRLTAGWALALSGTPSAGDALKQMSDADAKRDPGAVKGFLAAHARVSRDGLAAYYSGR